MIEHTLIERLSDGMKKILRLELEAGNEVKETYQGGFSEVTDDHVFVFLKYPFKNQYDVPGICYREINDPHYWKAEYDDDADHQTIACSY